jgi:SAM-dependent methyltransferase
MGRPADRVWERACPACGAGDVQAIYRLEGIPVHSALLVPTAEAARGFPTGEMALCWCPNCGLAFNAAFEEARLDYGTGYEDAQGHSPTFSAFARKLARDWIARYGLSGGHVVEVGCGSGDFLRQMCEEGGCRGTGFDPAFRSGRAEEMPGVSFHARRFTESDVPVEADFIVCRHTLEHVGDIAGFLSLMRRACGESRSVRLGFELPDLGRILDEGAFWDVYFEHASYFTAGSLGRAFIHAGFDVIDLRRAFGEQYLLLDAAPAFGAPAPLPPMADDPADVAMRVERFRRTVQVRIAEWRNGFAAWRAAGRRVALWGSGSKAVGFLTTIGDHGIVDCVVDINPARQGRFMPGCTMPIVAPARLPEFRPDVVLVMNSIYRDEIAAEIAALGLGPAVHAVDDGAPAEAPA